MKPSQEPKYGVNANGQLVNRETGNAIPDDEPVFILRGRDANALLALDTYYQACKVPGHKAVVAERINHFQDFAKNNPDRMREPGQFRSGNVTEHN